MIQTTNQLLMFLLNIVMFHSPSCQFIKRYTKRTKTTSWHTTLYYVVFTLRPSPSISLQFNPFPWFWTDDWILGFFINDTSTGSRTWPTTYKGPVNVDHNLNVSFGNQTWQWDPLIYWHAKGKIKEHRNIASKKNVEMIHVQVWLPTDTTYLSCFASSQRSPGLIALGGSQGASRSAHGLCSSSHSSAVIPKKSSGRREEKLRLTVEQQTMAKVRISFV